MKKIILTFVLSALLFWGSISYAATCGEGVDFSVSGDSISEALWDCTPKGAITSSYTPPGQWGSFFKIVMGGGWYELGTGVKDRVRSLTMQIMIGAGVVAVAMIVLSSILMILALGEEKKLWEAKNALKFSIIGFVCVIIAFPLVNLVINFIYGVASPN